MYRGLLLLVFLMACTQQPKAPLVLEEVSLGSSDEIAAPQFLSEWKLFDDLSGLQPASSVHPYEVNAPLFSDYAFKARFVHLPTETTLDYHSSDILEIPEQGILIKNFFYPSDFEEPLGDRRLMETRLLVNESDGWKPYTYIWNKDQTDAELAITGASIPISWKDRHGQLQKIDYSVPNLNQCKSCHERGGEVMPIGFSARQLNNGAQLQSWSEKGLLGALPEDHGAIPRLASWANEGLNLDERARSWLETNCAHCHREDGPAKNTGLYLLAEETDSYRLGINKTPVAAGRGSGGLKYAIAPGQPDQSILVHRIVSLDPGVMMPELGRKMVHDEGVELVKDWIASLD